MNRATCASVIVQREGENAGYEKLMSSSSFLCEDKTAEATVDGIVCVVERLKEKRELFLRELGEEEAARRPPSKEIGFRKTVDSSLTSDNDATALNASSFSMDFVETSARERMQTEGERDQLTEEERRGLSSYKIKIYRINYSIPIILQTSITQLIITKNSTLAFF